MFDHPCGNAILNQIFSPIRVSSTGRITLFLDRSSATKGGEWLLISHDRVEWSQLQDAITVEFPRRLAVAGADEFSLLTLRFEPFILAVECATLEAASRLLRISAAAGFRYLNWFSRLLSAVIASSPHTHTTHS